MRLPRRLDVFPRYVRTFPSEEVTTVSTSEVDPRDTGLGVGDRDAIWQSVVDLYETGLHPGIALTVRHRGQVVIDRTIGHARGNGPADPRDAPKRLATPLTPFNLFSASKVVTAMLIHWLDDKGLVHLDDAVAEYIPGFAKHGKGRITLRHVLTHRAGIPTVPGESLDLDLLLDQEAIVGALCDAKPISMAGRTLAYHAISGGFILGEVIRRVTGDDERALLTRAVRAPLGFDTFNYGVPRARLPDVAVNAFTGPPPQPIYGWLLKRALGVAIRDAIDITNDERFLTGIVPSGNIVATADECCRFFEALLRDGELDGTPVFARRTVHRAIAEQTYRELDTILMIPIRYGMGFMLGGDRFSFMGRDTPRAFGHLGFTNVLVYADPERDISVALLNNGKPFLALRALKWLRIMRVIADRIPRVRRAA